MRSNLLTRTRRWLGVSALAIIVATGGTMALVGTTANAQVSIQPNGPTGFADLVDAVRPAVVSITVDGVQNAPAQYGGGSGPGFNFDFPDLPPDHPLRKFFDQFGQPGQGQGQGQQQHSQKFQAAGSGFIISADGYVVTNNHVVENATKVTVIDDNGNEHPATIIGTDPRTDLAVLKIKEDVKLPFVKFAEAPARVGDWVVAMGNPFGLGGTVTAGIVSARGRDIAGNSYGDFLQIDAAVNRGNSGGPTFNLSGEVVGVNTAIFSPNGGSVGIAFAIPAATVKQVVSDLREHGSVTRGFLGVSIQDVSKDIADSVGLPTARGALVTEPRPDSPAATAGIKSGDVVVEVDGKPIENALDLSRTIATRAPGSKVTLTVWRDQKRVEIDVTLSTLNEEQTASNDKQPAPEAAPVPAEPNSVGLVLVPNSGGDGVLIQDIGADSVAADKGLQVGDVLLEADNKPLKDGSDFDKIVADVKASGRSTVLLKADRSGAVRFIGLPFSAN